MADWIYLFTTNDAFPEPLAEIAALASVVDDGGQAWLLLPDRAHPPLSGAKRGEEVLLCTRRRGQLLCHAVGVVAQGAAVHLEIPASARPIYGELKERTLVPLEQVSLLNERLVPELDEDAQRTFASGQAYVKRLNGPSRLRRPGAGSGGPSIEAPAPARVRVLPAKHVGSSIVVVGVDPTAATWDSRMRAGPKAMPSVALRVDPDGAIRPHEHLLERHPHNDDLWERVRAIDASSVAIDGPCSTHGLSPLPDWSGWDLTQKGGVRDGERTLCRSGVGLFWTTYATITRFDGASRWIARALRLFHEHREAADLPPMLETHPHGAFLFLQRLLGRSAVLAPKTTPAGRQQRLELLLAFVHGLPVQDLPDHDAVDAACAALVAALDVLGRTTAFGTHEGGGEIWMPALDPAGYEAADLDGAPP